MHATRRAFFLHAENNPSSLFPPAHVNHIHRDPGQAHPGRRLLQRGPQATTTSTTAAAAPPPKTAAAIVKTPADAFFASAASVRALAKVRGNGATLLHTEEAQAHLKGKGRRL
jgi:hypothetical protein